VRLIAIIAVIVAGLATASFNWHFSYELGRSEHEALTWAVFSVALDAAKWTMLIIAARSWPSLPAVAAILIWITATSYSFTAALGFASANRAHQNEITRQHRAHDAAVHIARRSPLWQSTHACTHVASRPARTYCDALRDLEARRPTQPKEVQTTTIANLFNITEAMAGTLLSLYLAIACEVISALGLFALTSPHLDKQRRPLWISRIRNRHITPTTTPTSSGNAETSMSGSKPSAPTPSKTSSGASWQRPRGWT